MEQQPAAQSDESRKLRQDLIDRLGRRALSDLESGTIVVLPSLSFPSVELKKISGIEHYEERMLFALLWLKSPDLRIVYVSSSPIDDAVIDYYLRFLPDPADARRRLHLVSVGDREPTALSLKLLARPQLMEALRALVANDDAYILPFNVTELETRLSDALDVPLYGPVPEAVHLGSKSGSRLVAREAGVAVPAGAEGLRSLEEVERAIGELRAKRPDADAVVIKLNNGFSGQGNVVLYLNRLRSPLERSQAKFCSEDESWPSFARKIAAEGGVVEELIRDPKATSPSVQLRIAPNGELEALSTHDQILGGPDEQVYLGCRFPARVEYRLEIQRQALAVAEVLAAKGVIGSFGMDFVVVPQGQGHRVYMSEINLRMGGTTHPFFMARFLTDGSYDPSSGNLVAGGRAKHYLGTDNLKSDRYAGLTPADVIRAVVRRGVAYRHDVRTGATLHLLGAVREYGKLGCVCIGDSPEEAEEIYGEVVAALEDAALSPGRSI